MVERETVVQAPGLHEAAGDDHAVDQDREHRPGNDNRVDADRNRTGQGGVNTIVALARYGGEVTLPEPQALSQEGRKREAEQDYRKHRGA